MFFPYAPAYREAIYRKIDETFDVDWFFCGNANRPLKLLDYKVLKHYNLDLQEVTIKNNIRYIKHFSPHIFDEYDVVIFSGNIRNISYWKLLFHKRDNNKPKIFMWTHGWYGREGFFQTLIKRFYQRKADGFLLYGNYAKQLMEAKGFPKGRLFVISNSLDYAKQLKLRESMHATSIYRSLFIKDAFNIVFIGRLTYEKKIDMLFFAIRNLRNRGVQVNLLLIGDGEATKDLKKIVSELQLDESVNFYGACYDEEKNAEFIYNADLCVSPGNVGLTAIHTMMFGCPVITHDDFKFQGPEFEAIRPNITGNFFKKDSIDSLTETLAQWIEFSQHNRDRIRYACYSEIDSHWNPNYQINVLKVAFSE